MQSFYCTSILQVTCNCRNFLFSFSYSLISREQIVGREWIERQAFLLSIQDYDDDSSDKDYKPEQDETILLINDQLFSSDEWVEELNLSDILEGILNDSPSPKLTSVNSNNYTCTTDKGALNIDQVDSLLKIVDMKIDGDKSASDKYRPDDEEESDADAEKTDESARIETGLKTGDF